MKLLEWALMEDESKLSEQTQSMADEFLLIIIGILCERFSPDVAEVPIQEEYIHRVIHLLGIVSNEFVLFSRVKV